MILLNNLLYSTEKNIEEKAKLKNIEQKKHLVKMMRKIK